MRPPNFSKLSTPVLLRYQKEIEKVLKTREGQEKEKEKLLAQFQSMAKKQGLSMADILAAKPTGTRTTTRTRKQKTTSGKRGKLPAKYANPADKSQTWSGRGRRPKWVIDHLAKGGKIDDFAMGNTRAASKPTKTRKRTKKTTSGKRGKLPPKYANPADKSQTWSGRGRRPKWVIDHLAKGGKIDDFAI